MGVAEGSTSIMGFAQPNLPPTCLNVVSCNGDACFNGNDVVIGTGGTNSVGKFTITLSPALACMETIYVEEVCGAAPVFGPIVVVKCIPAAPLLSLQAILFLVASLGMVGFFGLRRVALHR